MLRHLDLFSGIGGFSLGLERTGGFETVGFCEIDPYCRAVLRKHWPDVPIHEDVRELTCDTVGPVDIITGGFPCQDLSTAGNQAGITGHRSGLWTELHRLIGGIRPRYAIVENVPNLLAGERGAWFGRVLGDLAEIGFDAEWHCIPASCLGAPHDRDRVWIIAYPNTEKNCFCPIGKFLQKNIMSGGNRANAWRAPMPSISRVGDGIPGELDRLGSLGNAVVPQIPEAIGRAILAAEEQ